MESVLSPVVHRRLVEDLDNVCITANIPKHMIHESATQYVSVVELDWVRNFRSYQQIGKGMVLTATHADTKMMAITAALLRNFIDARIMTISAVLETDANPTVLLIPNLYITAMGRSMPAWQVQKVYDRLLERYAQGKPSVVYVENMSGLEKDYGPVFARHLRDHYKIT